MADACCEGTMDLAEMQARQRRVLQVVLAINVVAFGIMLWGWLASGASSLLSGTLDNVGDALTYALSLAVVGAGCKAKARIALVKGLLIAGAALFVAVQIGLHLANPEAPVVGTMSVAALLNLGANAICLALLTPHRHADINMASVWECSRNDIFDGLAVIVAAALVWAFDSAWPDLVVATALLVLFARSAVRVLRSAWGEMAAA